MQNDPAQIKDIEGYFERLLPVAIPAAGITLLIMIIIAGYKILSSSGDPGKMAAAWKVVTYGVIGLVVLLASVLLLNLFQFITGVDITQFTIGI